MTEKANIPSIKPKSICYQWYYCKKCVEMIIDMTGTIEIESSMKLRIEEDTNIIDNHCP